MFQSWPHSGVPGSSTLKVWINMLPPPAMWRMVTASLNPSRGGNSLSDCFCSGAVDINYPYFVPMRYMIFRTLENYYLKYQRIC